MLCLDVLALLCSALVGTGFKKKMSSVVPSCLTNSRSISFTEVSAIKPEDSPKPLFKTLFHQYHGSRNLMFSFSFPDEVVFSLVLSQAVMIIMVIKITFMQYACISKQATLCILLKE